MVLAPCVCPGLGFVGVRYCWPLHATVCPCLLFHGAGTLRLRLASVSSPHSYDLCPRLSFTACDSLHHQARNTQMQFICCTHIALPVFLTSFSTRGHVRHSSHVRRMAAASRNRCLVSSFLLILLKSNPMLPLPFAMSSVCCRCVPH